MEGGPAGLGFGLTVYSGAGQQPREMFDHPETAMLGGSPSQSGEAEWGEGDIQPALAVSATEPRHQICD